MTPDLEQIILEITDPKNKNIHETIRSESLLRETSTHYIRLIGDADRKARIMIVVNSIFLTLGITLITKAINQPHYVWISAVLLICSNLVTLVFTIIAVKPELDTHLEKDTENNILHYKKCKEYSLSDYTTLMLNTMHDDTKKVDAVIKELYYFGNLLALKYKLMRIAFQFFLWGIVLSVTSYLFILLLSSI